MTAKQGFISGKRTNLFVKYFLIFAGVFFVTLAILGAALIIMVNQYSLHQTTDLLEENTRQISEIVSSTLIDNDMNDSYSPEKSIICESLGVVSDCIDADLFICDNDGNVILCKEQRGQQALKDNCTVCSNHNDFQFDQRIIDDVHNNYTTTSQTQIDGKKYYVVGTAILATYDTQGLGEGKTKTIGTVYAVVESGATDFVMAVLKMFTVIALFCLGAAFILIWIATKRMVNPLTQMSSAAKRFAVGDFSYRVNVVGNDELADLGNAFNDMADALDKLESSRRSFVANVSHELKTPMTSIAGFIDGILDGTIPKDKEEYYLKLVSDEVRRLSRLVVAMLNMSKIESGDFEMKPKKYNVSDQIIHILLTFEQKIEKKNIEIIGLDELNQYYANADTDMIYQVVYNLFDNAVKFTNENGYIKVGIKENAGMLEISIKNSGEGINSDELSKIFERFYKVDKSRSLDAKGAGLGLYIVKMMVEMHGGKIIARSDSVSEAEFVFTLPKA